MVQQNHRNLFQWKTIGFCLIVILVLIPMVAVLSQNTPQPTISGKTATVALVPFGSVNAGPFIFSVDS